MADGTEYPDTLDGDEDNNTIHGYGGNDIIHGHDGQDQLYGDAGDDILYGDEEADTLLGGDGDDFLDGGDNPSFAYDSASYRDASAGVTVNLNLTTAQNTGGAGIDTIINMEGIEGSDFDDHLIGDHNLQVQALFGNGGDDVIEGGIGDDFIDGGEGDDLVYGSLGGDNINGGNGVDTIDYSGSPEGVTVELEVERLVNAQQVSAGYAAFDFLGGIENVTGSAFADTIYGDVGVNVLKGGGGDDVLRGRGGGDTLDGGAGIDTADYSDSAARVNINLNLPTQLWADAQGDVLISIENVTGSAFDDKILGNTLANVLSGGDGADLLNGGTGNDTLYGGAGADTLIGGKGADHLDGGADSDTADYSTAAAGVTVDLRLAVQSGGDAQGDAFTSVENLTGSAFADVLHGDAGANVLKGGDGDDLLIGGAGADTIDGGGGQDTVDYSASTAGVNVSLSLAVPQFGGGDGRGDVISGVENLTGSSYADLLTGNQLANVIQGGDGADTIIGGSAADTLTGGAGGDRFVYTSNGHSGMGAGLRDVITDFSPAQGDLVDVSAFAGDFTFVGTGGFTGTAHEVSYQVTGGDTIVSFDSNGDGTADFELQLLGVHTLTSSDFLL